ncbi:2439_t:CDS:2 [Racocetra fulgida]|uniref:2439_t:CDS:1 n=1 Tax=Racocetra fulgida TaxID=60492 RepID=A0A9N8VI62_9GLOM|nr:2439_t:CDS:2 [Racocetra fulgida]
METLQINNLDSINYSEVEDPRLVKIREYGIIIKGYWHEKPIIMKHLPTELANQDNQVLQLVNMQLLRGYY